ncbi:Ketosteroid isomerase-related protein [Mycolicibacterium flavescens]|uniref:nuclear transport factor 2 family protein n=1 Tax=Mycobacterium neumannii TaxID=2048551 RepID=UPI000F704F40|nr:nuclear transport factor 2 family protein [Mycobacterium neumannii]VEG43689.1 Ketosteroid isomerase-related protein [Mycolicibacterium flavescens]
MPPTFSERVRIVTEFLDSIGRLDFARVAACLAENAVMFLPFVDGVPPVQGRSAIADHLRNSVPLMFDSMNFTYDDWYDIRDADSVIVEYHSECPQKGTSEIYRNSYITVFRFERGKISLYKEYLNPLRFAGFTDPTAES